MIEPFLWGFLVGMAVAGILAVLNIRSYYRILQNKAVNRSAECINGCFYVIVPEASYYDMMDKIYGRH